MSRDAKRCEHSVLAITGRRVLGERVDAYQCATAISLGVNAGVHFQRTPASCCQKDHHPSTLYISGRQPLSLSAVACFGEHLLESEARLIARLGLPMVAEGIHLRFRSTVGRWLPVCHSIGLVGRSGLRA